MFASTDSTEQPLYRNTKRIYRKAII